MSNGKNAGDQPLLALISSKNGLVATKRIAPAPTTQTSRPTKNFRALATATRPGTMAWDLQTQTREFSELTIKRLVSQLVLMKSPDF